MTREVLCVDGAVMTGFAEPDGWGEVQCSCDPRSHRFHEVSEQEAWRFIDDMISSHADRDHGGVQS